MKTLQESIIGRKGVLARFTKDMLKPGYVVRYLDGKFAMYFRYEDVVRITRTRSCISRMDGEGGFFSLEVTRVLYWMSLCDYNDNLTYVGDKDSGALNIATVWPIKTQPQLLDQESLEHLTKGVASIKINR